MKAHATAVLSILLLAVAASSAHAAAPTAPSGVTRTRISDTQVRIGWNDLSQDEDGFEIFRRAVTQPDFESRGTVDADVTEFIDDAAKDVVYIYQVVAYNGDGSSDTSNICYVNRKPPLPPVSLNVRLIALTIVRISWEDHSSGEKGFEIQRADFGKPFKTIARVDANTVSYDDDTLKPANTYTYRVRTLGRVNVCWDNSKFTVERTVTTEGGVRIIQIEHRGRGKGTVTSTPVGISCGPKDDHCTAKFPFTTYVRLTAKPAAGSRFGGWADYGPCAGSKNLVCRVYTGADHVIGAAFRLQP